MTGLICAIAMMLPNIQNLDVVAFDGNNLALDHLSDILELSPLKKRFNIKIRCVPMPIKSMQDLNHYTSHLGNGYDIILSFKFVNELMQMGILGRDGFKVLTVKRMTMVHCYRYLAISAIVDAGVINVLRIRNSMVVLLPMTK